MNSLVAGQRVKLEDLLGVSKKFSVVVTTSSNIEVDISAFCLNEKGHMPSEEDMVFYNNNKSKDSDCEFLGLKNINGLSASEFLFDLNKTNAARIEKITLCATSDRKLSDLSDFNVVINDVNGTPVAKFDLKPTLSSSNKAIMLLDIYLKSGVWRFGANAQGFDGGLAALVVHFGQSVEDAPKMSSVDLKKKLVLDKIQNADKHLIDLTKKSLLVLEKKNLLDVKAQVCLVLDRSGSMNGQYRNGDVQKIVDRVVPLALSFDDNGSMECWAFGEKPMQLDDVSLSNVKNYIETVQGGWKNWDGYRGVGSAYNEEVPAIEAVMNFYNGQKNKIPTYVVFISDGGVHKNKAIKQAIIKASAYPIFWQFVGVGGSDYGILEKLDTMDGRIVDNCNFFSLDRIDSLGEEELYQLLLQEFPMWLKEAQSKHIF